MASTSSTRHLKEVFSYPFQDPDWVGKLVIASLLILFSFIPFFPHVLLLGYVAVLVIQVVEEGDLVLPAWGDLGDLFGHGLRLFGVTFVYTLPVIALFILGYVAILLPVFTMETRLIPEGSWILTMIGGYIFGLGMMGISMLLGLGVGIILPMAGCHAVVERDFGAAFRFSEWWAILRANWDGFLISYLLFLGGLVAVYYATQFLILTVILCCLYPFVIVALSAYLMVVGGALFGRAYREGREMMQAE